MPYDLSQQMMMDRAAKAKMMRGEPAKESGRVAPAMMPFGTPSKRGPIKSPVAAPAKVEPKAENKPVVSTGDQMHSPSAKGANDQVAKQAAMQRAMAR